MLGYMGSIIGDIACGITSQKLKSRKKAVFIFLLLGGILAHDSSIVDRGRL